MSLSQEERRARRKKNRMAGEGLEGDNPVAEEARDSVNEAVQDKSNNRSLDERFGEGFSERVSPDGLQDATNKGRYSKKELLAEFRGRGKDVSINEGEGNLVDKYQSLVDSGQKFNGKARSYLEGHGVTFGGGGNGDPEVPIPETEPTPAPTPTPTPTPTIPTPVKPPGTPQPVIGAPGSQIVNQDNDVNSNVTGDNNNVNIDQDNSVHQSAGFAGNYNGGIRRQALEATNLMDNYVLNLRKAKTTI